jgi:hypothetical protein
MRPQFETARMGWRWRAPGSVTRSYRREEAAERWERRIPDPFAEYHVICGDGVMGAK